MKHRAITPHNHGRSVPTETARGSIFKPSLRKCLQFPLILYLPPAVNKREKQKFKNQVPPFKSQVEEDASRRDDYQLLCYNICICMVRRICLQPSVSNCKNTLRPLVGVHTKEAGQNTESPEPSSDLRVTPYHPPLVWLQPEDPKWWRCRRQKNLHTLQWQKY